MWVWTLPSSLVTTTGISYDLFSSGYWDISLHQVKALWRSVIRTRFSHSDISGSKRLLAPYRNFSQPTTSFILFSTQGILSLLLNRFIVFLKNVIYDIIVKYPLHQHLKLFFQKCCVRCYSNLIIYFKTFFTFFYFYFLTSSKLMFLLLKK